MKPFKIFDLAMQVTLLLFGLVYILFKQPDRFLMIYFLVGGWQFLSFALHHFFEHSWIHTQQRKLYGQFLFWIVVSGLLCLALTKFDMPFLLYYLFALLIGSPVLAVWYFIIGAKELSTITKRELVHLK